jgi:competence protein ComEC
MVNSFIKWPIQPLARILILFFFGNLFSENFQIETVILFLTIFILACFLFLLKRNRFSGFLICIFIFLNGAINCKLQAKKANSIPGKFHLVKILPEPVFKDNKVFFDAELLETCKKGKWSKINGKARIEFNSMNDSLFSTNDYLIICDTIGVPPKPLFPNLFDYNKYLKNIGIYYYIRTHEERILTFKNNELNLFKFAIQTRESFIDNIKKHNIKADIIAVIGALILGARSELDKQIISDYTQSGIVHILAVSGLHVGLLYLAFIFMLQPFKKFLPKFFHLLIVLSFLWFYAILAGLSASIVRATIMCSIVAFASSFNLKNSNFNLLAAAAFLMLVIDNNIWKQLGFQLSFAAVWSIFAFNSVLDYGNKFKNWWLRNLIKASSLSIIAQLATSPLCLLYFGTFPTYFLFANLIAVPLSTLLTYLGIMAMVFGNIPFLGRLLAKTLEMGIGLMNNIAHFISNLPQAITNDIFISTPISILSIILIFCFSSLLTRFSTVRIQLVLICMILISSLQVVEMFNQSASTTLYILNNKDKSKAVFQKGKNIVIFNLWGSVDNKFINRTISNFAKALNLSRDKPIQIDISQKIPSKKYYIRYIRKCVLAS